MRIKCATCGVEFPFTSSYICPSCQAKIDTAKLKGAKAIDAALRFQRREIGFKELKAALAEAGIEYNGDEG